MLRGGTKGRTLSGLREFLLRLADDPRLLESYRQDPDEVLAEAGLTEEERELVKAGDAAGIRRSILSESEGSVDPEIVSNIDIVVVVYVAP